MITLPSALRVHESFLPTESPWAFAVPNAEFLPGAQPGEDFNSWGHHS